MPSSALAAEYDAVWEPASGELSVEARMTKGAAASLHVDQGADDFVRTPTFREDRDGTSFTPMRRNGERFEAPACASVPCLVQYRYALREAGRRLDDLDVASVEGEVIEAPPSTWLLAPSTISGDARVRFRVRTPGGSSFVTGVFPSAEAKDAWDTTLDDLASSPYSAFGPLRVSTLKVEGASLTLALGPGKLDVSDEAVARWVDASARAIVAYFGRFPTKSALVLVVTARGRWVGGGRTLAGGGGSIFMRVGARATPESFREDWVLVHEMTHLAFPSVSREHNWAEEGLATYVEPFARLRAGLLSEEDAWKGLIEGLPNGLPRDGDQGLDRTHTWGRTYWGGALFFFLADIEIRKATNNAKGLDDALIGVLDAGGNNAVRWSLEDVFAAGDRAVGVKALEELHAKMGTSPYPVDLAALSRSLGVEVSGGRVRFDDSAPLAAIRRAIGRGTRGASPKATTSDQSSDRH